MRSNCNEKKVPWYIIQSSKFYTVMQLGRIRDCWHFRRPWCEALKFPKNTIRSWRGSNVCAYIWPILFNTSVPTIYAESQSVSTDEEAAVWGGTIIWETYFTVFPVIFSALCSNWNSFLHDVQQYKQNHFKIYDTNDNFLHSGGNFPVLWRSSETDEFFLTEGVGGIFKILEPHLELFRLCLHRRRYATLQRIWFSNYSLLTSMFQTIPTPPEHDEFHILGYSAT
jgi:hypothetical protein